MQQISVEPAGEVLLPHDERDERGPPVRVPRPRADRHGQRQQQARAPPRVGGGAKDRAAGGRVHERRGDERRVRGFRGEGPSVLIAGNIERVFVLFVQLYEGVKYNTDFHI